MKRSILLIVLSVFLWACPSDIGSESIVIKNNSDHIIYFWYSSEYEKFHFPDSLPTNIPLIINSIDAGTGTGGSAGQYPSWQKIFSRLPKDKFTVYFFETYPEMQEEWDELLENKQEKVYRKDFTYEELQATDFHIYYP